MYKRKLASLRNRLLGIGFLLLSLGVWRTPVHAQSLEWNRNNTLSIKEYRVYGCPKMYCMVNQQSVPLIVVPQTILGTNPSVSLSTAFIGFVGMIAMSTVTTLNEESALSVPMFIDSTKIPVATVIIVNAPIDLRIIP